MCLGARGTVVSVDDIGTIHIRWDCGSSLGVSYGEDVCRKLDSVTVVCDGNSKTWDQRIDAIRRVKGVKDAKQYTVPVSSALNAVRNGENPELSTRQKHTRECFVVAEEGADLEQIERDIKQMPNYFADYDTTVNFISEEELKKNHSTIPHGGFVFRSGKTGWNRENSHIIEYSLKLDSNPQFTASVLVAYARAAYRLNSEGKSGCMTVFDIAPAYLLAESSEQLRKKLL